MSYPPSVKDVLERAAKRHIFSSTDEVLAWRRDNCVLALYRDDLYSRTWVLDLTHFVHPEGVGPTKMDYHRRKRIVDITGMFSTANHNNSAIEQLLLRAIGEVVMPLAQPGWYANVCFAHTVYRFVYQSNCVSRFAHTVYSSS